MGAGLGFWEFLIGMGVIPSGQCLRGIYCLCLFFLSFLSFPFFTFSRPGICRDFLRGGREVGWVLNIPSQLDQDRG